MKVLLNITFLVVLGSWSIAQNLSYHKGEGGKVVLYLYQEGLQEGITINNIQWDFGDGSKVNSGSERKVVHSYKNLQEFYDVRVNYVKISPESKKELSDSIRVKIKTTGITKQCPRAYYTIVDLDDWCNPQKFKLRWTFCGDRKAWSPDSVLWSMWDGHTKWTHGTEPLEYSYSSNGVLVNSAVAYFTRYDGEVCKVTIFPTSSSKPCEDSEGKEEFFREEKLFSSFSAKPNLFIPRGKYCVGDSIQIFDFGGSSSVISSPQEWSYELFIDGVSVLINSGLPNSSFPIHITSLGAGEHIIELVYIWPKGRKEPCMTSDTFKVYIEPCNDKPCEICPNFRPEPTKRYWLSAWVKEVHVDQVKAYTNSLIQIEFLGGGGSQTVDFYPTGDIVEGWQRIVGDFTLPSSTIDLKIHLLNISSSVEVYFDDIRIHSFNSSMKSYVYDPQTLLLTAELDDNNYATFYEYDNEKKLIRIKKETARGIMTIQESSSSNPKEE